MKETCLQLLIFSKTEKQLKEVYDFLNGYKGQSLVSVPIPIKPARKTK